MTSEEAIEILKDDEMYITDSFYREFRTTIADKYTKAFETVLNLIKTQQEEIQQVLDDYQDLGKEKYKLECELEKKEAVIDEMAKHISNLDTDEDVCKNIQCTDGYNRLHKNCFRLHKRIFYKQIRKGE